MPPPFYSPMFRISTLPQPQTCLELKNEHVALFPLLADYWDKPQSELPEVLRARVGMWVIGWDGLSVEDRMQRVYDYDYLNHPANAEEEKAGWDLAGKENDAKQEIIKWEQMNHENDPIKAKIQDEKLDELRIKLADIERRLKLPPAYIQTTERGAREESTAVAKTGAGTGINLSVDDDTQMKQLNMTNLAYWRTVLYLNIKIIDTPKKASVRKVIKYLRGLNDKRIPDKGTCDELFWIDNYGNEENVIKKTVSTASSFARNLP